jgi:NAD(P)-dependent dehydrogenase (short-subunit alcohol dehydrogenase family)
MSPMFDMTGRVALITGATRGIGRCVAEQYVRHGARVIVNSRKLADCEAVAEAINRDAGHGAAWPCAFDFSDQASIEGGVDRAIAHWDMLDTLVGNAYVTALGTESELDPAVFADVLRINVVNNAVLANRALPALRASGEGVVIFIGSASGLAPSPAVAAYGISKRALMHMMQNLAVEWGHDRVRVNAVIPGLTRTPTTEAYWQDEAVLAARVADWPLQRIGEPEEIAAACVFLAAPSGRSTTGHAIISDGGRTLGGASPSSNAVPADFKAP